MSDESSYTCVVCGFQGVGGKAWEPGDAFGFGTCPACLTEYGYDEANLGLSYPRQRDAWVSGGMQWSSGSPPIGWDPLALLDGLLNGTDPVPSPRLTAEEIGAATAALLALGCRDLADALGVMGATIPRRQLTALTDQLCAYVVGRSHPFPGHVLQALGKCLVVAQEYGQPDRE